MKLTFSVCHCASARISAKPNVCVSRHDGDGFWRARSELSTENVVRSGNLNRAAWLLVDYAEW
jgi:hypothetical protein